MKKTNLCSVNLDCPVLPCPNYYTCKDLGISWEIPWHRNADGLFVKKYGWRRQWTSESLHFSSPMNRCPINGSECGYYNPVYDNDENYDAHPNEMNRRMIEAWRESGFLPAEDIEEVKKFEFKQSAKEECSTDEIPF